MSYQVCSAICEVCFRELIVLVVWIHACNWSTAWLISTAHVFSITDTTSCCKLLQGFLCTTPTSSIRNVFDTVEFGSIADLHERIFRCFSTLFSVSMLSRIVNIPTNKTAMGHQDADSSHSRFCFLPGMARFRWIPTNLLAWTHTRCTPNGRK